MKKETKLGITSIIIIGIVLLLEIFPKLVNCISQNGVIRHHRCFSMKPLMYDIYSPLLCCVVTAIIIICVCLNAQKKSAYIELSNAMLCLVETLILCIAIVRGIMASASVVIGLLLCAEVFVCLAKALYFRKIYNDYNDYYDDDECEIDYDDN